MELLKQRKRIENGHKIGVRRPKIDNDGVHGGGVLEHELNHCAGVSPGGSLRLALGERCRLGGPSEPPMMNVGCE